MAQFLETIIRINAEMGNGFSKVGATLTELGSIVDGLSMELIDFGKESVEVYRDYEKSMRDAEVALSTNYGQGTQQLQRVMSQLDEAAPSISTSTNKTETFAIFFMIHSFFLHAPFAAERNKFILLRRAPRPQPPTLTRSAITPFCGP